MHTTPRVAALWPGFLEVYVNVDSLTVCYHHCDLVVRLVYGTKTLEAVTPAETVRWKYSEGIKQI